MNKTELIAAVAEKSGISKKDAEKAVSSTIETIINTVAEGEKIQIAGFGTFEQRQRNARTGCDPRTGNSIEGRQGLQGCCKQVICFLFG